MTAQPVNLGQAPAGLTDVRSPRIIGRVTATVSTGDRHAGDVHRRVHRATRHLGVWVTGEFLLRAGG